MSEKRSPKSVKIGSPPKRNPEAWVNQGKERPVKADKGVKRLTLDIPEDLHRALKRRALEEDTTMLNLVEKWIEDQLR